MKELLESVCTALTKLAPHYATQEDIHKHTKIIGETIAPVLAADRQLNITNGAQSVATLKPTILSYATSPVQGAHIEKVLASITSNGATIERETGLNATDLLSRCCGLAQSPNLVPEEKGRVAYNLASNIQDGGGCIAGICGRLGQLYLSLLQTELQERILLEQVLQASREDDLEDRQQLEIALQASITESQGFGYADGGACAVAAGETSEVAPPFNPLPQ